MLRDTAPMTSRSTSLKIATLDAARQKYPEVVQSSNHIHLLVQSRF